MNETQQPKVEQVNIALGMLAKALEMLKNLGIIPAETPAVPAAVSVAPQAEDAPIGREAPAPDSVNITNLMASAVPSEPPVAPTVTPPVTRTLPQRGPNGLFLPKSAKAAAVDAAIAKAPKAPKPTPPPKPVHKFPAPGLVDDFVKWFFQTPQEDLYSCKCGQYEVRTGSAELGLAHVLIFHTSMRIESQRDIQRYEGKTDIKLQVGDKLPGVDGNNIIGIRPIGSTLGVFNANKLLYGNFNSEQLRPQVAAELAGAVPVPFENVVAKSGGAGLDLAKLKIVSWTSAEDMVIPPVKRGRQWTGKFYVIKRHFAGALVLNVEDKYFLFDADREELTHCGFNPFFTQLPKPASTVEEAYDLLMPDEVKEAKKAGKEVLRQGEFFFIKQTDEEILKAAIGVRAAASNAVKQRQFLRLTEDLTDVGDAHYMWMAWDRGQEVQAFIDRCNMHNGGVLPEGKADTPFPDKADGGDFRGVARSDINAETALMPLFKRYMDFSALSEMAVDRDENGTVIDREMKAAKHTYDFENKRKACIAPADGCLHTHMGSIARALQISCAAQPTGGVARKPQPQGQAAHDFGVYFQLRLGKEGEMDETMNQQASNAHIATGTMLSKYVDGGIYAIGAVTHTGREHRPLHLPGWYKVVSNTATANWTVSGAVD